MSIEEKIFNFSFSLSVAEEMMHRLEVCSVLPEDLSSVPSSHVRGLTAISKSSSGEWMSSAGPQGCVWVGIMLVENYGED